jgi:acetyl esterase/lipase
MTFAAIAAAACAALVGVGVARRRRKLSGVAPDLRHPALYVPFSLRGGRTLRLVRRLAARAAAATPVPAGVRVRSERVPASRGRPEVRVLVYERAERSRPSGALLWIHGGGLVMGTPEQGHEACARFAEALGVVVVNVDYRLAPDHPFPAALDDCEAALAWLHAQAGALGVDPGRIAVGGDSAGGGLAACLAQRAHDRGGPAIRFQLLVYPMLDDRTALRGELDALVWTNASNRFGWSAYLGHPVCDVEERPHAAAARRADLRGLPPAWIGIGDVDLFHGECLAYASRLRAAGVPCELHRVPGMYHGADRFRSAAPAMRGFAEGMTSALGAALAR